jgi:hypothetical protein
VEIARVMLSLSLIFQARAMNPVIVAIRPVNEITMPMTTSDIDGKKYVDAIRL